MILAAAGSVVTASAGTAVYSGSMLIALPIALLAGIISFASPCVLPLVPGYLGFVSGMAGATVQSPMSSIPTTVPGSAPGTSSTSGGEAVRTAPVRGRLVLGVGLFIAGFTLVFVIFGALFGTLGGALQAHQDVITRVLGVVVIVMGLAFLGMVSPLQTNRQIKISPSTGLWGAPALGFVFGLGWTPCMGPALVAINALALDQGTAGRGALLAVAYCLGLGIPFLLIALGLGSSAKMLTLMRRHRLAIMRIGGALLIAIGLALVTGLWNAWTQSLAGLIGGFETLL